MTREKAKNSGYSFIKENADTDHPQTILRSAFFVEIVERYGGEVMVLQKVRGLFREEVVRREAREESGAAESLQPYVVVEEMLGGGAGGSVVCELRIYVLTENEELLAYCQVKEVHVSDGGSRQLSQLPQASLPPTALSFIQR